jgi:hypothetical protein
MDPGRLGEPQLARQRTVRVSLSASDEDLLQVARSWVDVLAAEDYDQVFENLGYAMAAGAGPLGIRRDIERYRSSELYPGVTRFTVTTWSTAVGGNPDPTRLVRRYKYSESLPIVATIEIDLPLNGRWSDLEADFVVTVRQQGDAEGTLALEDICSPASLREDA